MIRTVARQNIHIPTCSILHKAIWHSKLKEGGVGLADANKISKESIIQVIQAVVMSDDGPQNDSLWDLIIQTEKAAKQNINKLIRKGSAEINKFKVPY